MKNDCVAIVLAGGEGKRFWPLQKSKSMFPFCGLPLLVYNLNRLKKTGITDVIVVIHSQDKEAFSALTVSGLSIRTVVQPDPNGMAGGVLAAASLLEGKACFTMNATDLVEEKLYEELASYIVGDSVVSVGKKVTEYFPGSYFVFEGKRVVGVVEKPGQGNEPSDVTGLVLIIFRTPKDLLNFY